MFCLWSHVPHAAHACRKHPQIISAARPSFEPQFFPIGGMPSPVMEGSSGGRQYLLAPYNTVNAGTDMLDITDQELETKCRVHGQWMARYVARNLFLDGLFRGKGSHNDGAYGGAFHFTHLLGTNWVDSNATYYFASLMQHPLDAAPRTSTLKTSAGASRSITLPKRNVTQAGLPLPGTTQADIDAIEAKVNGVDGVRQLGYYTLRTANARAIIKRVIAYFAPELKVQCDAFPIPAGFDGAGTTVELCYPKLVPMSVEQFGYAALFPSSRLVGDGGSQYYELTGSFFHERGDPAALRTQFTSETIFKRKSDGRAMSFLDAINDDPILKTSDWLTRYAPLANAAISPGVSTNENFAFRRLEWQAADWAIEDSVMATLRAYFPLIESVNFDFVECKSPTDPYVRVGQGLASAQTQSWLTHQGPTLYGRNSTAHASVAAIRDNVVKNAVEAWDALNLDETLRVMNKIRSDKSSVPFISGIFDKQQLIGLQTTEWGGTKTFFKQVGVRTHEDRGVNQFNVYSGDLDRTYGAIAELTADLEGVT